MSIADVIRKTESRFSNRHLISGQEAFTYEPFLQSSDKSFKDRVLDVVNIHPLPNTTYGGKSYEMGEFMSKQLKLCDYRDFCLAAWREEKPLNMDEDNVASRYMDFDGWTIHRKRAWTALMCGCHYDYIDFSINKYVESGTPQSQKHIRFWMKHLSEFIHSLDLVHVKPVQGIVKMVPYNTVESVLVVKDIDYYIYLADKRELNKNNAGMNISGNIIIKIPSGKYMVSCFSPITGLYSPAIHTRGGDNTEIQLPDFRHDITVCITRMKTGSFSESQT
jgi:hypothetical protein